MMAMVDRCLVVLVAHLDGQLGLGHQADVVLHLDGQSVLVDPVKLLGLEDKLIVNLWKIIT